jgi:hypothetical protein
VQNQDRRLVTLVYTNGTAVSTKALSQNQRNHRFYL